MAGAQPWKRPTQVQHWRAWHGCHCADAERHCIPRSRCQASQSICSTLQMCTCLQCMLIMPGPLSNPNLFTWPCYAAGEAGSEERNRLAGVQPVASPAAAPPGTSTADVNMADDVALQVAPTAGPSAGSQAAASEAAPAKTQPPAKRAAAGEAAPANGQPPAKRAKQAAAPAAAVTLPSSAGAKAALLQQLEAETGQLVKDMADLSPLVALPAALSDAQKAKGLVKAEVGLQHWTSLLNIMIGCAGACGSSTFCQCQHNPGSDAKGLYWGLSGCCAASPGADVPKESAQAQCCGTARASCRCPQCSRGVVVCRSYMSSQVITGYPVAGGQVGGWTGRVVDRAGAAHPGPLWHRDHQQDGRDKLHL